MPRKPVEKKLRTGFTTGACAAAAAKAAARFLVKGVKLKTIETTLPNGQKITFVLNRCEKKGRGAVAGIIKDAGDDPDCTHRAEIRAAVMLKKTPGVELINGRGVGTVTKPGLGLEVGSPSITSVPRRNITAMVQEELTRGRDQGARVVISVPGGAKMAKKTINARLGIVGGISILGTTGIVRPFSTASFKASVVGAVKVARGQGIKELVMTTGGRSEKFAMRHFPDFPQEAFIQAGDFIGVGLKSAAKEKITRVRIAGMIGKLSKMADGKMQTHVSGCEVNRGFLAKLAQEAGANEDLCKKIRQANTARHVLELATANMLDITGLICREVSRQAENYVKGAVKVSAYLFDFNGNLLARHTKEKRLCPK